MSMHEMNKETAEKIEKSLKALRTRRDICAFVRGLDYFPRKEYYLKGVSGSRTDAEAVQCTGHLVGRHQAEGGGLGLEPAARVRIEADDGEGYAQSAGGLARAGDDGLMPAMDAVERADGHRRALQRVRQVAPVADDLDQRADGLRRRGTRTVAMPSMISLPSTKPSQFSSTRALS